MITTTSVYVGIDPTSGIRPSAYAVLTERLEIEKLGTASTRELIELVSGYKAVVCAVDAPIRHSKGLLADPEYRLRVGLDPKRTNYSNYRVCEYELRRRKINLYSTPTDPQQAHQWMQEGWRLYEGLRQAGFVEYPQPGPHRLFETYPHAAFMALVKSRPQARLLPKTGIEGLLQRQRILYEEGVEVPDPIAQLEEWTSHRLITGQIGSKYDHDSLDALMAAYTAFVADREPRRAIALGDVTEGQIILPVESLQDTY